ncbi:hypothetical protein GGF37_007378, partial [Kickxella alabastrina]
FPEFNPSASNNRLGGGGGGHLQQQQQYYGDKANVVQPAANVSAGVGAGAHYHTVNDPSLLRELDEA